MNREHNPDHYQVGSRARGRGGGRSRVLPAHGGMDRFEAEYSLHHQADSAPSHGPVVGLKGESVGSFGSNRAVMNYQSFDTTIPIRELNPYISRWSILARCTTRAEIRRFTNSAGESQVFSFDVIDADRGEIRCTIFGEAVDLIYPLIEVGRIYRITGGNLSKKTKYCNLDHNFEIRLDTRSIIDEVSEQSIERPIPYINYKFKKIDEIKDLEANSIVDVLGVLIGVEPSRTITKKNGNEVQIRKFSIKDESNFAIDIALWDDLAIHIGRDLESMKNDNQTHIIAAKGVRVGVFNGVSLNSMPSSNINIDGNVPEAKGLREWALRSGDHIQPQTLRQTTGENFKKRSFLADINISSIPQGKPSYDTVLATVTYVKDSQMYYAACPLQRNNRQCSKKLIGCDRDFSCEACGQSVDEPNWRYCLSLGLRDHTDGRFVTVFDVAEEMLGIPATELKAVKDTSSCASYIERVRFKTGMFTIRSVMDEWNGDLKLKMNLFRQEDINFVEEAGNLLSVIEKYQDGGQQQSGPSKAFHPGSVQPATPPGAGYGSFMGPSIGAGHHRV